MRTKRDWGIIVAFLLFEFCGAAGWQVFRVRQLHAQAVTASITLSWNASPTANVTYTVSRGASYKGPFTALASGLPASTLSYTDSTVVRGTEYYYQVSAVSGANSALTNVVNSTVMPLPAALVGLQPPGNLTATSSN
jgi:hypothetical protein